MALKVLGDGSDMLLDGDLIILDERLLQQANLLEVLADAAHDDLL